MCECCWTCTLEPSCGVGNACDCLAQLHVALCAFILKLEDRLPVCSCVSQSSLTQLQYLSLSPRFIPSEALVLLPVLLPVQPGPVHPSSPVLTCPRLSSSVLTCPHLLDPIFPFFSHTFEETPKERMASSFSRILSCRRNVGLLSILGGSAAAAGFLLQNRERVSAGSPARRRYPAR